MGTRLMGGRLLSKSERQLAQPALLAARGHNLQVFSNDARRAIGSLIVTGVQGFHVVPKRSLRRLGQSREGPEGRTVMAAIEFNCLRNRKRQVEPGTQHRR